MSVTTTSDEELKRRARLAFTRTRTLLEEVDPGLRLRSGDWTARDVAAHLLTVLERYTQRDITDASTLGATVEELTRNNADDLAALSGVGMDDLLSRVDKEFTAYLELDVPLDAKFPFHGGSSIDGAGGQSNWIGELLLHGYDVAQASRRDWPLEERDFVLVLNGALQVAPAWLDPKAAEGVRLDVLVKILGATPQLFHIEDEVLTIRDGGIADRVDAVVRAPAVPLALMLYGRTGLASAVRHGVLVTGGRRPWLGLRLPKLFMPI